MIGACRVVELFRLPVASFGLTKPMRTTIDLKITAFPRGISDLGCERDMTADRVELVVGKRQWHMVMTCADGVKRSFGEGTSVLFCIPPAHF